MLRLKAKTRCATELGARRQSWETLIYLPDTDRLFQNFSGAESRKGENKDTEHTERDSGIALTFTFRPELWIHKGYMHTYRLHVLV